MNIAAESGTPEFCRSNRWPVENEIRPQPDILLRNDEAGATMREGEILIVRTVESFT